MYTSRTTIRIATCLLYITVALYLPYRTVAARDSFTTTLTPGSTHPEVLTLQRFLNSHGFTITESGPGSSGAETDFFGTKTKEAVMRFQTTYASDILAPAGLTTPTGTFGPASIRKANTLLQSSTLQSSATTSPYTPTPHRDPTISLNQYEYLLKQIEQNRRNTQNAVQKYSGDTPITRLTGVTLDNSTFTNTAGSFSTLTVSGLGTLAQLSVAGTTTLQGPLVVARGSVPSVVTDTIYNVGGDLFWNGTPLTASTTGSWSNLAGNAYRLTGSVGIGTSTPDATLDVVGTIHAGTTTAPLLDEGGAVCNVQAYGAVGDNATDNYSAIMAAINACPLGGTVFFPMGVYRIGQTLTLDKPITLKGSFAPRWTYSSTPRSSIKPTTSFVGTSIVHVRDKTISGQASDNNGGRITNLTIDGNSFGSAIDGIYFEGLVRDWKLEQVDITQTSGNGFHADIGDGAGNPRGFTVLGLSIYSAALHGFRATALNDSYLEDVLTVGNAQRGFYLSSMGETKIVGSRAVFNALEGLYIDGSSSNGGLQFTDFSTDRNDRHGVRISAYGTTTITFNGLLTRRDGPNTGGGTETPYAGVAIIGSTTAKVAPVTITNLSQILGVNDDGSGTLAPHTGVRAVNATYVNIDGILWGTTNAYIDGGNVDAFIIKEDALTRTGVLSDTSDTRYAAKWATATNTLSYRTGSVGIGTTSPARLLHISSSTAAGVRMTDTTNNVTGELRADDFQVFMGSISNHDVRVMTNGSSRLSVTTAGFVGIGTTSPGYQLHVSRATDGDVAAFSDLNGTCTIDPTNTALICSSDQRLKKNIETIPDALERLTDLRGVHFLWNHETGTDDPHVGFIAQEVAEVFPEFVEQDTRGYFMVNTNAFTPVLVESVKALNLKLDDLAASVASSTPPTTPTLIHELVAHALSTLETLGVAIKDGVVRVKRLVVDDELCIGATCIHESELAALLSSLPSTTTTDPTPTTITEATTTTPLSPSDGSNTATTTPASTTPPLIDNI
jgi:Chaperone of endosialidase/Pectate lyase superfamily protein/Putative peptidoglycan binding domain